MYGERWEPTFNFFLLCIPVPRFENTFLNELLWHSIEKSIDQVHVSLFLDSLFFSTVLYVNPFSNITFFWLLQFYYKSWKHAFTFFFLISLALSSHLHSHINFRISFSTKKHNFGCDCVELLISLGRTDILTIVHHQVFQSMNMVYTCFWKVLITLFCGFSV